MGLHLENDEDAGKLLERMMEQFEIDLGEDSNEDDKQEENKKA